MSLLKGKVSIITGGSRGIGRSICLKFAEQGSDVIFTYRSSKEQAKSLQDELSHFGVKSEGIISDASDFQSAQNLIEYVEKKYSRIDILINNAGITKDGLLMRMTEEDFDKVISINMKSVFNMTKCVQRTMLKQRSGSIVNLSSIVGVKGNAGQSNYSASKAGIIGFTKSIALELGSRNIRCNAIAPGFIQTEMTDKLDDNTIELWKQSIPLKRGGEGDDVGNACLFLASDLSSYITGQVINVCGGLLT
jgi:3-oxoacyl-[acyl-carrier protein] reductase